jgi:hypothetical protein
VSRDRCGIYGDGRHRFTFAVSRLAGTPHYGCGFGCPIVLPGESLADDVWYVSPDVLVVACAACGDEGDVGGMVTLVDDDTAICGQCEDDPAVADMLAARYGDLVDH